MDSSDPYPSARRSVVAKNFRRRRRWSMKHHMTSFVSNMISIHEPRSGMMRTERSCCPFACVVRSVEMPGLRCSC